MSEMRNNEVNALEVTYNILVDFGEGVFISDYPTVDFDKRPMLSDLRDSGEIEQHADLVIFSVKGKLHVQGRP